MSRKLPQIVLVTLTQGDHTSILVFPFLSFMIFHVPLLFFPKKVTTNPITIMSYFRLAQTSFSSFSGLFGKSFPELFCPQYATRRCLPTVENEMTLIYCILICKRRGLHLFICRKVQYIVLLLEIERKAFLTVLCSDTEYFTKENFEVTFSEKISQQRKKKNLRII